MVDLSPARVLRAVAVCAALWASGASFAQAVFRVTTIPEEAATEQMRMFGPIATYLEQKLGMKVEFTPV
ncbi:MAG: phosphonate ABC transporter substrate-binding protein, partial [Polaromonas sp. 24-62-144]